MNQLTVAATAVTMTSREIAELTGKEHKNVMADIRSMLEQLDMTSAEFSADLPDTYGRLQPAFRLPKDLTITLVSGYSVAVRHRIVTRWQELEAEATDPVRALNDPGKLRQVLLGYTERVIALESKVVELTPKANALDRLEKVGEGSFCLTDAAKDLQVAPRAFTRKLQEIGWIYRRPQGSGWLAYQHRIAQGVLEHKVTHGEKADGSEWVSSQVRVTARGMARLAEIFEQEKAAA